MGAQGPTDSGTRGLRQARDLELVDRRDPEGAHLVMRPFRPSPSLSDYSLRGNRVFDTTSHRRRNRIPTRSYR